MLTVAGLRRRLPAFELQAEFTVPSGARAALVGPSGFGKTTLLRLLAGLDRAETGQIRLGDRDITALPPEKRDVGFVFQDHALFPTMSVLDNATFGLRMRGVPADERRARALPWLTRLGVDPATPVDQLSGGERARLACVRAWIWKPALLLLDEPFGALDPALRAQIRGDLIALHAENPVPLIFVSHDDSDVQALATMRLSAHDAGGDRRIVQNER